MKNEKRLRYRIEKLGFSIVLTIQRLLSRRLFLGIGSSVGRLAFHIDRRHRKIAMENFRRAFPNSTSEQAYSAVRNTYIHFARFLFDLLSYYPEFPDERMKEFEFEGAEYIEAANASGKGIILITGHWGAWELMALAWARKGVNINPVARRLDNPFLDQVLTKIRTSTGNVVIEKTRGLRDLLRFLRQGRAVALLIDQNVTTEERIFVDFFGYPASTTPAAALLKLRTGAHILPCFAMPLPNGRYRFISRPPVEVEITGDRKQDVFNITQQCTKILEEQIRAYPQYWLWMHRRWKTQPEMTPKTEIVSQGSQELFD